MEVVTGVMQSVLKRLTDIRGVVAAAVFDADGDELAFYGHSATVRTALSCGDLMRSQCGLGASRARASVVPTDDFDETLVLTQPMQKGFLIVVTNRELETNDRSVWFHLRAAARDLDLALRFPLPGKLGKRANTDGPISETMPCLVRPPGY